MGASTAFCIARTFTYRLIEWVRTWRRTRFTELDGSYQDTKEQCPKKMNERLHISPKGKAEDVRPESRVAVHITRLFVSGHPVRPAAPDRRFRAPGQV